MLSKLQLYVLSSSLKAYDFWGRSVKRVSLCPASFANKTRAKMFVYGGLFWGENLEIIDSMVCSRVLPLTPLCGSKGVGEPVWPRASSCVVTRECGPAHAHYRRGTSFCTVSRWRRFPFSATCALSVEVNLKMQVSGGWYAGAKGMRNIF